MLAKQPVTSEGEDFILIFAIEAGTELANASLAANRIVGFSLPGNDSYAAGDMSDEAWAMFDAAIGWLDPPLNLSVPVTPDTDDAVWVLGDYHLLSGAGRYDLQTDTWVTDSVGSPCIDAGDPSNSYAQEPAPNGDCINMGAYGGTVEASKTRPMLGVLYAFDLDWAMELCQL